ncbi:MAG TPA: hypothetical protein VGN57_18145 [Pirellulaceae bacterium]|jgi:hypothetical protein|nr:hypothetical protein [Pirellulaceae bacterium]
MPSFLGKLERLEGRARACLLLGLAAALSLPAVRAPGQEPSQADAVARYVAELGDASYEVREEAYDRLVAIGEPAMASLEEATLSPDIEVAHRARRATERIRRQEFERRLSLYLNGELTPGRPLLGQAAYEELCGSDPSDREFFVTMLRAERDLALAFERASDRFPETFKRRFEQVVSNVNSRAPLRSPPPVPSIAMLLLVLTDPSIEHPRETFAHSGWSLLASQPYFQISLESPQRPGERLRAIVGEWILAPSSTLDVSAKCRISVELDLPQGMAFAARYAFEVSILPNARPYALQALAVLGGREHAARLLPLLDDETICMTRYLPDKNGDNVRMPIQIRDVALGWLLYLTDQDPKTYGYSQLNAVFERVETDPSNVHSASNFWFADSAARDAAFVKWEAWLARNPLPPPPELLYEAR